MFSPWQNDAATKLEVSKWKYIIIQFEIGQNNKKGI